MAQLSATVSELPESRVRIDVEVPAEEVERRLSQAARRLGSQLRIPGFRKGKVPPAVVLRRLGREAVLDEAVRDALGEWYVDALERSGVVPIGEPDFDLGQSLPGAGEPLRFSIQTGVLPTARLGEYRGLEVGRREPSVDEADVERELERLRERLATLETVQRPAQLGDHVVIDYTGTVEGRPLKGGEARDQVVELGSGRLLDGFEEQLVGASAGERRTVAVTFPPDFPDGELAGRQASFEVTVSEVKAKRLPPLDDEFAAEASEFDTLTELRADIEARLRAADERAIEREFAEAVLDAAVDAADVTLPGRLVHARAHELLEQTFRALERQGIARETYLKVVGKDEEELAREAEADAERELRREAVLAAIVAAEGIEPSDEDLAGALRSGGDGDGSDPAELVARLRETEAGASGSGRRAVAARRAARTLRSLREEVAARKAVELLVSQARPITVEQAKARSRLWTPGRREGEGSPAPSRIWTPGG